MKGIALEASAWLSTFPHRVAPLPDEWLPGLLLRCDEANHWQSGTTFRHLLRSTHHPGFGSGSSLVVFPFSILEYLAPLLEVPVSCLLATTYAGELARLYAPNPPHSEHLVGPRRSNNVRSFLQKSVGMRAITAMPGFHICPICIAQARLLRRTTILPHLNYCPIHHVAFHAHCTCGFPLLLFSRKRQPFVCFACGLDWAQLPHIPLPADQVTLEHDLWAFYELFLLKGSSSLKMAAGSLVLSRIKEYIPFELRFAGRRVKHVASLALDRLSLRYLLDILVSIGISPDDFADGLVV